MHLVFAAETVTMVMNLILAETSDTGVYTVLL